MIIKHKLILCFLLTLVLFAVGAMITGEALAAGANWYNEDWFYRKQITINSSQVPGDLTNFPVLINITDSDWRDTVNGGKVVQSDGGDILFADSLGNKLSHEIEKYDPTTGELIAWVKVPSVSSSPPDTFIYIYYGNTIDPTNQWDIEGTWDNNYLGVWHLKEDPSVSTDCAGGAGTLEVCDSTLNSVDGDSCGIWNCTTKMDSGDQVPGQIGGSLGFDGSNDWIELGNPFVIGTNFTIEGWINARNIVSPAKPSIFGRPWNWHFQIHDSRRLWFRRWAPYQNGLSTTVLSTDRWYHVVVTLSTGPTDNLRIYIDGALDKLSSMQTPVGSAAALRMARFQGAPDIAFYDGFLDEMRMSDTVRSPEWIEASYNNQKDSSTFLTFSEEAIVIPTMTEWGMIIFMVLAGLIAIYYLPTGRFICRRHAGLRKREIL